LHLIAALAAGNFEFFSVVNCNVVAQVMPKCDIMAAFEFEFLAFQNALQDIFQEFGLTVLKPLFVCHNSFPENRSPADP